MADTTGIEWTDATWNVITGCSITSPGCRRCYAMKLAGTRLKHHPSRVGLTKPSAAGPVWTGEVRFNPEWLDQPQRWRRARDIFVCAHGDLFHEKVPDQWIDQVFAVMANSPWHRFQVLTKRSARMRRYLTTPYVQQRVEAMALELAGKDKLKVLDDPEPWPLRNVILMVSAERQQEAAERIPDLLATPAAMRGVSLEPLLGPVDLPDIKVKRKVGTDHFDALHYDGSPDDDVDGGTATLDWVIVGGESADDAVPMNPRWAREIRDQCAAAGVPFLHKQNGCWAPGSLFPDRIPSGEYCDFDGELKTDDERVWKVGKKLAGRLLDGRTHDGFPEASP